MNTNIKYAFFDLDETVVSFKTMFNFLQFFYIYTDKDNGLEIYDKYMDQLKIDWQNDKSRELINREYYHLFSGVDSEVFSTIITKWYDYSRKMKGDKFYINPVIIELKKLIKNNTKIVFVSGSIYELANLIAKNLNVDHVLATKIEKINNVLTGEIIPPQTIGAGKAIAVNSFMQANNISPQDCIAYGDHISDFEMLKSVGAGVLVSKDQKTISAAKSYNWKIINDF
ncbi:HAD-IB family hydrolase [Vibrio sp. S11_S32]|uniref:HAD family hydrolase n=1 Tax=Vibrio sp. S11_S32 TaxID=2720225 RepID=UPI001681863A|nr:HAD-IB family hydrolase [Vibrio sp. S11_S32]MBD1577965.1 HAD-IB family hydrolase [Vibrio sp. S11_S32]